MSSTDHRIKTLKTRLKSLLTSFNLTKIFVDKYDEQQDAPEIPVRLENLDEQWTDFKMVQSELETIDEASIDDLLKQRTEFETAFYRVKGFLLAMNKSPVSFINPGSSSSSHVPTPPWHVRLPDVKLPVFSGNLDDWLNFHDLFVALVHSSVELSNIQKFYYLRSSLAGEALQLVQTIKLSATNYVVAWNMLVQHYQNTTRLKQSYLDNLFEFGTLKRESAADLHSLVKKFEANVKVLKQLGERTEYWDIVLIRMLSVRLNSTTRRDWEEFASTKDTVSFEDLTTFIQRRVTVLQTIQGKAFDTPASTLLSKQPTQRPLSCHDGSHNLRSKCVICSDNHPLYMCESFSQLSLDDKESEIRRHQFCRNCFRQGHLSRDCSSSSNCRRCRTRHRTQLCPNPFTASESPTDSLQSSNSIALPLETEPPIISASATITEPVSYASTVHGQKTVLFATAVIFIVDDNGTKHVARALLDSGSECSFITEHFSKRLKVQRKRIHLPISGIGKTTTQANTKFVSCIKSRVGEYSTNVEFVVLPNATNDLPATSIDTSSWDMPPGIHLADPSFHNPRQVDVIIGAEIFFELFGVPGRIPLGNSLPVLVNSTLGWIVCGKSEVNSSTPVVAHFATTTVPAPATSTRSCEDHPQTTDNYHLLRTNYRRDQHNIFAYQPSSFNADSKQSHTTLFGLEATAKLDTQQQDALPAEKRHQFHRHEINDHRIHPPKLSSNFVYNSQRSHLYQAQHCPYASPSMFDDYRPAPKINPKSSSKARRTSVLQPTSVLNLFEYGITCHHLPGTIINNRFFVNRTTTSPGRTKIILQASQLDGKQHNIHHLGSRKRHRLLPFYQPNCIIGARADVNKYTTDVDNDYRAERTLYMRPAVLQKTVNEVIKTQKSLRMMSCRRKFLESLSPHFIHLRELPAVLSRRHSSRKTTNNLGSNYQPDVQQRNHPHRSNHPTFHHQQNPRQNLSVSTNKLFQNNRPAADSHLAEPKRDTRQN